MKIVENRTKYETRKLRSIVCATYAKIVKTEGRLPQWNRVKVHFVPARKRNPHNTSGWAVLGGATTRLRIPRGSVDMIELVKLIDHELHHLYGFNHDKFSCASHDKRPRQLWAWSASRFGETLSESVATKTVIDRSEAYAAKISALRDRIAEREAREARLARATKRLRVKLARMIKYAEKKPSSPRPRTEPVDSLLSAAGIEAIKNEGGTVSVYPKLDGMLIDDGTGPEESIVYFGMAELLSRLPDIRVVSDERDAA